MNHGALPPQSPVAYLRTYWDLCFIHKTRAPASAEISDWVKLKWFQRTQ